MSETLVSPPGFAACLRGTHVARRQTAQTSIFDTLLRCTRQNLALFGPAEVA
jgi:hypothetical protein